MKEKFENAKKRILDLSIEAAKFDALQNRILQEKENHDEICALNKRILELEKVEEEYLKLKEYLSEAYSELETLRVENQMLSDKPELVVDSHGYEVIASRNSSSNLIGQSLVVKPFNFRHEFDLESLTSSKIFKVNSDDSKFDWEYFNKHFLISLNRFATKTFNIMSKSYNNIIPNFDEDIPFVSPENKYSIEFHDSGLLLLFDELDEVRYNLRIGNFIKAGIKVKGIADLGSKLIDSNFSEEVDSAIQDVVIHLSVQYLVSVIVCCNTFVEINTDRIENQLRLPTKNYHKRLFDTMWKLAEGESLLPSKYKLLDTSFSI